MDRLGSFSSTAGVVAATTTTASTKTTTSTTTTTTSSHNTTHPGTTAAAATGPLQQQQQSRDPRPVRKSNVLGSISGQRSASGTMSPLVSTGSFDIYNNGSNNNRKSSNMQAPSQPHSNASSTGRERTHSDPHDAVSMSQQQHQQQQPQHQQHRRSTSESVLRDRAHTMPTVSTILLESPSATCSPRAVASPRPTTTTTHASPSSPSDDEELRVATSMALAIQSNPNLTVDEIRHLMAQQQQLATGSLRGGGVLVGGGGPFAAGAAATQPATQTAAPLIPGRLTSLFSSITTTSSTLSLDPAGVAVNSGTSSLMSALTGHIPAPTPASVSVGSALASSSSSSYHHQQHKANNHNSSSSSLSGSASFRHLGESLRGSRGRWSDILTGAGVAAETAPTPTWMMGGMVTTTTRSNSEGFANEQQHNRPMSMSMVASGSHPQSSTLPFRNTDDYSNNSIATLPPHPAAATAAGTRSPKTNLALSPRPNDQQSLVTIPSGSPPSWMMDLHRTESNVSTSTVGPAAVPLPAVMSSSAPSPPPQIAAVHRPSTNNNINKAAATRIRLVGLAWKRRGGMGKYSSSSAWERRRIELQGTKLLYYLHDEAEAAGVAQQDETAGDAVLTDGMNSPVSMASIASIALPDDGNTNNNSNQVTEGVVVSRRTTLFELAASTFGTAVSSAAAPLAGGSTGGGGGDDPMTHPRGYLDLAKDRATVNAAFGHSGAPTPFALSIKVRGETKWKLCFDSHKAQMEWLAAITDVVIQTSVDVFNTHVLHASDPSGAATAAALSTGQWDTAAGALFQPPPASAAPGANTHRLWMMDRYVIRNLSSHDDDMAGVTPSAIGGEDPRGVYITTTRSTTTTSSAEGAPITTSPAARGGSNSTNAAATAATFMPSTSSTTTVLVETTDHSAVRQEALEMATQTWMIPEQHLWYMGACFNLALALARTSTLSTEAFWYLVAFGNLGWCILLVRQPDWKSLLDHVRAPPTLENAPSGACVHQAAAVVGVAATVTSSTASAAAAAATAPAAVNATIQSKSIHATNTSSQGDSPQQHQRQTFIPRAGSSAIKVEQPTDPPVNSKNQYFAGWRSPPGDTMLVRSHGYLTTKKKIPSPGELFECAAVDVFESPSRYPDMGPRVHLPSVSHLSANDDKDQPKTWRTPDIFIISIALPTDPPKLGRSSSDGGGYTITMYFTMKPETRAILKRVTADGYDPSSELLHDGGDIQRSQINAVRLLEEWVRRAPNEPKFQSRFKIVPNAHNLKEIGMPAWIANYNGKPFLIKRPGETGFLYSHPELSCMEFDVSLHPFPYLAKQAICFMKDSYFKRVLVSFGFVIEGRADHELPECVIGVMQLCYPDPIHAIQASDFFAGNCPRSFE